MFGAIKHRKAIRLVRKLRFVFIHFIHYQHLVLISQVPHYDARFHILTDFTFFFVIHQLHVQAVKQVNRVQTAK